MYYYNDDVPVTPPIRRASLHTDKMPVPPAAPVRRRHNEAREEVYEYREERYEYSEEDEYDTYTPPRETSKIIVTRRPRSEIYEPPPSMRSRSRGSRGSRTSYVSQRPSNPERQFKQQPRPLSGSSILPIFLQRDMQKLKSFSQNRTALLIVTILLALFIMIPLAMNIGHGQSISLINIGTSDLTNGTATANAQSNNPNQLLITPPNNGHPAPPVFATSAYLLDADTGATLYAHNPFMHLPMLSTTKLMTALLAVEQGNLDQKVTINDQIANDINQLSADSALMGLKKGETYTMRDLLYGLLLPSGNDAAIAIADTVGGNLTNFVAKMNQRASQIGLKDTHFQDPHGLLMDGHYSSAHDLAVLGKVSLSVPNIHEISNAKQYHIPQTADHAEHFLSNGNQFLFWYPGTDGGKTGWDAATDFIQVISCTRNGHHLIGVVMHTNDWWTDMRDLMNWGFSNFTWISPHDLDSTTNPIPFDTAWNYFAKDKKENTISMGSQGRYYIYTGYSISGLIMAYFDKNGGLKKFGFPTGAPKTENNTLLSQQFEHGIISCNETTKQCQLQ